MERLLRRLLGLYFVIISLEYVPGALTFLAVENTVGPWWALPLIPLSQAAILSVAGLMLLRGRSDDAIPLGSGVVFPPIDSLLKLVGVYFIVTGLGSVVEPAITMLFVTEAWVARVGHFASAAVWLVAGWGLVRHPQEVLKRLTSQTAPA